MYLIRVGAISGYEYLVKKLGHNPVTLLADVGLSVSQLRNPDTYVSYRKLIRLLEHTAQACDEPLFGLLLSECQTSRVLGAVSITTSQSPTIKSALQSLNNYLYLHIKGLHLNQRVNDELLYIDLVNELLLKHGDMQFMQMASGQLSNFMSELLDKPVPLQIYLKQSSPVSETKLQNYNFRVALKFNSDFNGVCIAEKNLEQKPRQNEEALRSHFNDYISRLQQRYPDNLQDQVLEVVGQILPSGECSLERVAATLDLHPRVLQKRLKQQQTSYIKLLQQKRMEFAKQHLQHNSMPVTELALNLGYAEVAIFSRHFKKWTGLSPRNWQKQNEQR